MDKFTSWFTPKRRQYIYRIANAGVAIAVGYGVVEVNKAALWGVLVNAVLGMADANVDTSGDGEDPGNG